jgi:hypothetical protein
MGLLNMEALFNFPFFIYHFLFIVANDRSCGK